MQDTEILDPALPRGKVKEAEMKWLPWSGRARVRTRITSVPSLCSVPCDETATLPLLQQRPSRSTGPAQVAKIRQGSIKRSSLLGLKAADNKPLGTRNPAVSNDTVTRITAFLALSSKRLQSVLF